MISLMSLYQGTVLISFHFLCGQSLVKEKWLLVFPRNSCYVFISNIDDKCVVVEEHNCHFLFIIAGC